MQRDVLASPDPHTQLQAIESVQSSHALPIHLPAFATQEHPNAQRTKSRARRGQIANAYPQGGLIRGSTPPVPGGPTELCEATGPQATDLKRPLKPGGQFSTACGP